MFSIQDFVKLGLKRNINELVEHGCGSLVLNIGAGKAPIEGTVAIDYPEWDAETMPLNFEDGSVAGIHAYHFLEHVSKPTDVLREFERVLQKGGYINIVVPYYNSNLQAQDLTHVSAFSEETFPALLRQGAWYSKGWQPWDLQINANFIFGVAERNLCLFTQLVKI
jgi:ubiquinone/menaquinone biosynthesis C-methylase UbiE